MTPLTITIPCPVRGQFPNGRVHWGKKSKLNKKSRANAKLLAIAAGGQGVKCQKAEVRILWHHKTLAFPDRDGALSSLKATLDGVADSGFIVNDRGFYPCPVEFAKDAQNPRVEITFTPTE